MMLLEAQALGLTGHETPAGLNADATLIARLDALRVEAGRRMGLGDVSGQVIPKPVLIAPPAKGGDLAVRYFMPQDCHPALATTGAVGIATACVTEGTVASRLIGMRDLPAVLALEHPSGQIDVRLRRRDGKLLAGILRTARRLFEGRVLARPLNEVGRAA